ncbi:hypothetical protein RHD99_14780 [Buttiauxella selenatireducens]|uniref:Uncharacterized protein n=1 Tax=Buttiauxella selenatireducens TaxID=3073902 RepID=A0ABY9S5F3_9ENTR|nr:hypothetical protein [Buttiauxella sp. R73]WMY72736.1 hypothetical protein RHD99_14780 [Buttiauxella sp. R73]
MLSPSSLIKSMHNASRADVEQYCNVASVTKENLIAGLGAIGDLMFWAASGNERIEGEDAEACLRTIGLMLQTTTALIEGIDAAHEDLEFAKRNQGRKL